MGLFNKLFGRGRNGNNKFTPSIELMPDDTFWRIITTTFDSSAGDFEVQQEELEKELRKLSPQDVILFDNKFRQLRGHLYNWELWGAIYIIHGGCSDDSFMDFRDWVIAQGQEFYTKTLSNPESLVDIDEDKIEIDCEGIGYIARTVFTELTGQDIPSEYLENQKITGKEWTEEGDDLKKMFPKLYAKYNRSS
jgi:hypothetical protein